MKRPLLLSSTLFSSLLFLSQTASAAVVPPDINIGLPYDATAGSVESGPQEIPPFPAAPKNVGSSVTLTSNDEPGGRIVIAGTVYHADRTTPYAGLVLYLYQTDAGGRYNRTNGNWREPNIKGWVKTDKNGRYEIRTIKPGQYPNGKVAAHIHAIVKLAGESAKWINVFLFDGDSNLKQEDYDRFASSGSFSSIMKPTRSADGVVRYARDIRVTTGPTPD